MGIKVLGVGGSMRAGSHSTRTIVLGLERARELGAETRFIDLRELDLPMFRPKLDPIPEVVRSVARDVAWADAYLIGSPDYHGSMSGAVKNFLDYHWKEFAGKLFGLVCASHEKGLTAMDQMRTAVRQCYGWSLPYGLALHADQDIDHAGELSPKVRHRLNMLVRDLVAYGTLIRDQFDHDLAEKAADTFAAHYRR